MLEDRLKQQLLEAATAGARTGVSDMQDTRFQSYHALPSAVLSRATASASMEGVKLRTMYHMRPLAVV
jgi:hypothetical protein